MEQHDLRDNLKLCLFSSCVAGLRGAHPVSGQAVLWHYNILTFVFQPPFVMEKWILGIMENQTVECTVTYEVSLGQGGMKGPMALPSVS